MKREQTSPWPPLITAASRPRWIVWRDFALTAFMWGIFVFLVQKELDILWHTLRRWAGRPVEQIDHGLREFIFYLWPTVRIILILIATLGAATLVSRRRRDRSLRQLQPLPLPDALLAPDIGLDEQQLKTLRLEKIVTLDVDREGNVLSPPCFGSSPDSS